MRPLPVVLALAILAGCSTTWDPHRPKTIFAPADGGRVALKHGQRLRIPLAAGTDDALEWRRVEPPIMTVIMEGAPDAEGISLTPVRTGQEHLVFEYRPVSGEGGAQKTVAYDVTVR